VPNVFWHEECVTGTEDALDVLGFYGERMRFLVDALGIDG
jgi:hypothetical protein